MNSKLTAISSSYGILHFNRQLEVDDDLAHAVYRYVIEYCYCVDDAEREYRDQAVAVEWDEDDEEN